LILGRTATKKGARKSKQEGNRIAWNMDCLVDKTKYFLMQKGSKIQPQIQHTFSILGMERIDEKIVLRQEQFL